MRAGMRTRSAGTNAVWRSRGRTQGIDWTDRLRNRSAAAGSGRVCDREAATHLTPPTLVEPTLWQQHGPPAASQLQAAATWLHHDHCYVSSIQCRVRQSEESKAYMHMTSQTTLLAHAMSWLKCTWSYADKLTRDLLLSQSLSLTWDLPPQAEALLRLCMPLRHAGELHQLTLVLCGRAASAVPARLPALGRLTQLRSLELSCVALDVPGDNWVSALAPLTRLTRLCLEFGDDGSMSCEEGLGEPVAAFPWEAAVCGLVDLQELRVGSDLNDSPCCTGMFKGSLPASLSRLTAMQHFEVLGMAEWGTGGAAGLQLAALPALERAALRLQQPSETGQLPTLRRGQLVELCRLVSLSLALRVEEEDYHEDMHLPAIAAPALTELVLDDIKLAADSEQLPWLSDLPKLLRLMLANLRITSRQVPEGVRACSGLTELVLQRMEVGCYSSEMSDYESDHYDKSYLRTLSDGPYLSRLARLSLFGNAFSAVPPALMAATSLELLDMAHQDLPRINVRHWYRHGFIPECDSDPPRVQGLRPLNGLTRLCCVNLCGFEKYDAWIRQFQATHPHVSVILE